MSNQEPQNQSKIQEDASVEKRRRFIKGAGIATPVVLSLMNRSAFGAAQQCLSQQISGNMSHVGAGSCVSGQPPSAWRGPNAIGTNITEFDLTSTVGPTTTEVIRKRVRATFTGSTGGAGGQNVNILVSNEVTVMNYNWHGTGFKYGVLTTTKTTTTINRVGSSGPASAVTGEITVVGSIQSAGTGTVAVGNKFTAGTKWEYTGANPSNSVTSPLLNAPNTLPAAKCSDFTGGTTFNAAFGYGSSLPMREILCTNAASADAYCVTALLNASFVPAFNYVLNVHDVKALCNGTSPVPHGSASLSAFLTSTWLNQP